MKKPLVTTLFVVAVLVAAQAAPQQEAAPAPQAATTAPAQQKKEIRDPAEYNAYMAAINLTDPAKQAVALEGFLTQYPGSVMKEDALELLMATYQKNGDAQKVIDAGTRLLQVNPNNLRGLALITYLKRQQASAGGPTAQQLLGEAQQYGQRGLQAVETAQKSIGMSDADWSKLKRETSAIFHGAIGFAAVQAKNYPVAQENLLASVKINPNNPTDVYPLALAYLQADPPDYVNGLWYIARAVALTANDPATSQQLSKYGRSFYIKYHGGEDGWDKVLQTAAANPTPPEGFVIKPAPTPAEQAGMLVQSKPVKEMSFDEFQLIFTSGNQQAADQVWNEIKGKPIAFQARVISATPTKLVLAATAVDIEANKGDVELTMAGTIPPRLMPKVGGDAQVQGTPQSYTTDPFLITMTDGALISKAEPPSAKKPPTRRRPR